MLMMPIGNIVITIMNHLVNVSLHIWPSSDDDDGVDDNDDYEDDGEDEGDSDDHHGMAWHGMMRTRSHLVNVSMHI